MSSNIESSFPSHNGPQGARFQEPGVPPGQGVGAAGTGGGAVSTGPRPPQPSLRDRLRRAELERAETTRRTLATSERERLWFAVRIALACIGGCTTGAVPMAWALHTTDIEMAQMAWAGGQVLGPALVIAVLLYGWIRWDRDEW